MRAAEFPERRFRRPGPSRTLAPRMSWSSDGQKLAYVYFEEEPGWRSAANIPGLLQRN